MDLWKMNRWWKQPNQLYQWLHGYNQGQFSIFLFLPNHYLHYLAFFRIQRKAIWTTMLFMLTAKSGKFLHSGSEREFTVITSIQEKTASTVNDKKFSGIIIHIIIDAIQLKYRSKLSANMHRTCTQQQFHWLTELE